MIKNIFLINRRSLLFRLLWPVNLISTVLLIGFSISMAIQHRSAAEMALRSKSEALSKVLSQVGEHLIGTKDESSLTRYSSRLDPEILSVSFLTKKTISSTIRP